MHNFHWKCDSVRPVPRVLRVGHRVSQQEGGITVLGSPIGSDVFIKQQIDLAVKKMKGVLLLLERIDDAQVRFCLLRSCLGSCRINHLLRTVTQDVMASEVIVVR